MTSKTRAIITLLRPKQWIKNGFVLAPLCFSLQFSDPSILSQAFIAMVAFTLLSCSVYIINDIADADEDRLHPKKCKRPIAANIITRSQAYVIAAILFTLTTLLGSFLPPECYQIMALYLILNILYSLKLKKLAIIDVLILASGFILRLLMGGIATQISLSPWIIMTTFLLALFLGFGKRHQELQHYGELESRVSLKDYNRAFLDKLITISCSATLLTYAIYVVEIAEKTGKTMLVFTIFFVVFGLFRYLQILYVYQQGEEPESILFRDFLFLGNIVAWLFTTLWILSS